MVSEMLKKKIYKARFHLSCNHLCTLSLLMKMLLANLKKMAEQNRNQKCKECKDGEIYQDVWPVPLQF